jgi:hypothetical protein
MSEGETQIEIIRRCAPHPSRRSGPPYGFSLWAFFDALRRSAR